MMLVYLSGPIIHENLRKDDFYRAVVNLLEKRQIDVFAPQFMEARDARHIYERDVEYVRRADALIAEVSNPSLGVGMELMLSIELGKPVIMFRHTDSDRLSRMAFGASGKVLFEYATLDDVEHTLESIKLTDLIVRQCDNCESQIVETHKQGYKCVSCGFLN